jgi:protein-tyrosine phosphatase
MIDIHCHILPAIDDGPSEIGESVEMAKIAAADGVRAIVASPHFSYGERPGFDEIKRAMVPLRKRLKEEAVPVELIRGADVRLTYELLQGIGKGDMPTINGSRYFLLELPDIIPPNLDSFLRVARRCGFVPIITHPERNYSFLSSPRKLDVLRQTGVLVQITAMSISGEFGMQVEGLSNSLLKNGLVDFVATDAHGTGHRRPVLSKAYGLVSRLLDRAEVKKIFFDNPEAVLGDRQIAVKKGQ